MANPAPTNLDRSRRGLTAQRLVLIMLGLFLLLKARPASTQSPPAPSTIPPLPPGITLAQGCTKFTSHCVFFGRKMISSTTEAPVVAPLSEVMPSVLNSSATSLDQMAKKHPCLQGCCDWMHSCTTFPDDAVEGMLQLNSQEKLYKQCDIIEAAGCSGKCSQSRVAAWKANYPDQ